MEPTYDALILVSFGGPEGMDEVLPFLEHVLRGTNVPRQRVESVARHYEMFGGVSPLNGQNRALIAALEVELSTHRLELPIYWGNRNWRPFINDTMRQMMDDGVRRVLAFVTAAYGSYSTCRQYLQDLERARQALGASAPAVDKLRVFYNHPGFVEAMAERVETALDQIDRVRRDRTPIVFTAHSIPLSMAGQCAYVAQLKEASRLVCQSLGHQCWSLAYQSRSGPPKQPWLEPDVCDHLRLLREQEKATDVVVAPIGFICDHMEVIYDLDTEARELCEQIGLQMVRAATVGTHQRFISMIRELIVERMSGATVRPCLGTLGPGSDMCDATCCPLPAHRSQ